MTIKIIVEGPQGSGKSTIASAIVSLLRSTGWNIECHTLGTDSLAQSIWNLRALPHKKVTVVMRQTPIHNRRSTLLRISNELKILAQTPEITNDE